MMILYALLNGFYEEFFFLGLLTSVKEKYKWWVLLYSMIIRVSFHTYHGMLWALTIGVGFGLLYYCIIAFTNIRLKISYLSSSRMLLRISMVQV